MMTARTNTESPAPLGATSPPRRARRGHTPRLRPARTLSLRRLGPITEGPAPRRTRMRDALYRRSLALADALGALTALVCIAQAAGRPVALATLAAVPIVVVVAKLGGLYERDELVLGKSTLDEAPALLQVAGVFALLAWLFDDVLVAGDLGRAEVLALWGGAFALLLVTRAAARALSRSLAPTERCLFVGDAAHCEYARSKIAGSRAKAEVISFMPLDRLRSEALAAPEAFAGLVGQLDVDRVIIAPLGTDSSETVQLIRIAKAVGVRVSVLPRIFEVVGSAVEFDEVAGMTMLGVRRFGLTRSSRAIKRAFDVAGAGLVTLVVAPLLALLALAVKLDSSGPVLFGQVRVGRDGRRFRMFKFRSMVDGAEAQQAALAHRNEAVGLFKIADDPRVTRVGRFMRKTSLDELPQLFNVLRGEMSLVGPRPLVVDEDAQVQGLDRSRLHLTPGMTGVWQILGSARIPMHEMVGIDYLYVANWSLWSDVKILLRTVPYVLSRSGM